jgi:hypothetical protein
MAEAGAGRRGRRPETKPGPTAPDDNLAVAALCAAAAVVTMVVPIVAGLAIAWVIGLWAMAAVTLTVAGIEHPGLGRAARRWLAATGAEKGASAR